MNEDYLWDRKGEPDPEIASLEQLLGPLKWSERAFEHSQPVRRRTAMWLWAIAAAAVILLAAGSVIRRMHTLGPLTSWQLTISGAKPNRIRAGQVIETMSTAHATLESEFVGEVQIEPDSRLRLVQARQDEQRMALDRGTIHARIWAPPAKFVVDTPAARTVDLGCEYTLSIANDGKGFLTVHMGWVAFQWHDMESFIPAGAACTTRPGHGPDTPHFLDAPEALTKAVAEFDLTGSGQALNRALAAARPRDGLTLWHLLQRTHGLERAEVFDRFASLVKLPAAVSRGGALTGEPKSMDAAWDALNLGDTSWWRNWKRQW